MVTKMASPKGGALLLLAVLLLIGSTCWAWNSRTFSSKQEECVYHEMRKYHSCDRFFVTVEEKDGWYFFTEDMKKYRFTVPEKKMKQIIDKCMRRK